MMEQGRGIEWIGIWAVVLVVVVVFACVVALGLGYGIEDSRANRAQAKAAAEQAIAGARAAEAKAEVGKVEAQEEGELARLVERNRQELALLREENRQFQERLVMLATVIEGMDPEKVNRLEELMNGQGKGWAAALWLAVLAFCLVIFLPAVGVWAWSVWRRFKQM